MICFWPKEPYSPGSLLHGFKADPVFLLTLKLSEQDTEDLRKIKKGNAEGINKSYLNGLSSKFAPDN